ncbi:MAG: DUF1015 family protein [Nitriliruptoraceae bacterium]
MIELLPVSGHLVADAHASAVIAPAYDSLDPDQRRAYAAAHPASFLTALPTGEVDDAMLAGNRRALERLLDGGRFTPLSEPALLVLELTEDGHTITAVIGDLDVCHYLDGTIRPHEHVRPDRVHDLARYLDVVEVASSPVCVLHQPDPDLTAVVARVRAGVPVVDATLTDHARIRAWTVGPGREHQAMLSATRDLREPTIADGHHRAAAVAHRVGPTAAEPPGAADATEDATEDATVAARRVLTALVPADELRVEPFHRRIDDLLGVDAEDVAALLAERGLRMRALPGPAPPPGRGTVHLTVAGSWWSVRIGDRAGSGPVDSLDAHVVEREIVQPLSTLAAHPEGARVVPVPGPLGFDALTRHGAVGIVLTPPTVEELLRVIAAGEVLPHKSTYLVPKLRSGVIVVPR